jgi:catechol 2,3-dioxygenase-like lactoylglutathione lyase family enzyme
VITRFDHLVIAVSDLDRAIDSYRALGFEVFPGGRHEHRGTHNALIRFGGLDYVELLGVYDREKAMGSGLNGRTLAEFVAGRDGGLVGHCYATDDIEAEARRAREAGVEMVGPFEMRRARPDGRALTWRLTVPVDVPWRRRWPFVIQWDDPDEERLAVEGVGRHENGAGAVVGVSVAVRDLEEATDLYSVLFGSAPRSTDEVPDLAAARARFEVRGFGVDLLAPTADGPVREALERDGEGPFEARVRVEDLAAARAFVPGVEEDGDGLRVPSDRALGARIRLVQGEPT